MPPQPLQVPAIQRKRLRRLLRLFFLGVGLVFFLLYLWQTHTEVQRQRENSINLRTHQLNTYAQQIRQKLDRNFHDLEFLRKIIRYRPGQEPFPDAASRLALESFQKSHRGSLAVNIQDADGGTIVWSTNWSQGQKTLVSSAAFRTASNQRDWLVGNPLYARRYGNWIVPMRLPLYDASGKTVGFLGRPTALQQMLSAVSEPGVSILLERAGHPFVERNGHGQWGGAAPRTSMTTEHLRVSVPGYPWDLEMRWQRAGWFSSLPLAVWLQTTLPFLILLLLLGFLYRVASKALDYLLDLRQFQSAAIAIQHRLLRVKNRTDLYPTLCDALIQEGEVHSCFLLQRGADDNEVTLLAVASVSTEFAALRTLPPPAGREDGAPITLVTKAFHLGSLQRSANIQDCILVASLRAALRRERLCCALAQPVFLAEQRQPWGVLLCLQHWQSSEGDASEQFLLRIAESFGLVLSLWHRRDALDQAQGMLDLLADFDPLTGAANRGRLEKKYTELYARVGEGGESAALAIVDLDDFHQINHRLGRDAADRLLYLLRERLEGALAANDLVARLGGDEFILLFSFAGDEQSLRQKLIGLESALDPEFALDSDTRVPLELSIGVAVLAGTSEHFLDSLLRSAQEALRVAKIHKKDRLHAWVIAGQALETKPRNRAQRLLANSALEVWYQPIIDGLDGRILGVEALARLADEDGQILAPAAFLPYLTAEEVQNLSWQLLSQALEDVAALERDGWPIWLSFNVPAESFTRYCLPCLRGVLANCPLSPQRITMEILESGDFLDQPQAVEVMREIRAMGIHLALDDVGTAYASLQRLRDLPVDKIKVDQHFVRTLPEHPQDLHFIRILQDLAEEMGLDMVVEGVESAEILDVLLTIGVRQLQGYAISRPVPMRGLRRLLEEPFRLTGARPATLLGLYAGILSIHAVIKKTLQPLGRQLFIMESALRRDGPYDRALIRLGYGPGEPLHLAYRHYQSMLSRVLAGGIDSTRNQYWLDVECALRALQTAILAERERAIATGENNAAPGK